MFNEDSVVRTEKTPQGLMVEAECDGCSYSATSLISWADMALLRAGKLPQGFVRGDDGGAVMLVPCQRCYQQHVARGARDPKTSSAIKVFLSKGDLAELTP